MKKNYIVPKSEIVTCSACELLAGSVGDGGGKGIGYGGKDPGGKDPSSRSYDDIFDDWDD